MRVLGEEKKAEPTLGGHELRADQRERTEQRNWRGPVQWGWRRASHGDQRKERLTS